MRIEGNKTVIDGQGTGRYEQTAVTTEYKSEGAGAVVEIKGNKEKLTIAPGKTFKEVDLKKGLVNESGQSVEFSGNREILENVSGSDHNRDDRTVVKKN